MECSILEELLCVLLGACEDVPVLACIGNVSLLKDKDTGFFYIETALAQYM